MVARIDGNCSLNRLSFIQNQLNFVHPDRDGNITDDVKKRLNIDVSSAIDAFGENKNVIAKKISDLISKKQTEQTSKETSPDMDLSLDESDGTIQK